MFNLYAFFVNSNDLRINVHIHLSFFMWLTNHTSVNSIRYLHTLSNINETKVEIISKVIINL